MYVYIYICLHFYMYIGIDGDIQIKMKSDIRYWVSYEILDTGVYAYICIYTPMQTKMKNTYIYIER